MTLNWKPNWDQTQQRLIDWWNQKGFIIGRWGGVPAGELIEPLDEPEGLDWTGEAYYMAGAQRARIDHYRLAQQRFPAEIVPVEDPKLGPGSLCLHLGGKADFTHSDTVWFDPVFHGIDDVEDIPALRFTGDDPYWLATEQYYREMTSLAAGKHLVGVPDLCHDLDVLASLRDPNNLLIDLVEEPQWVHASLDAINTAYKQIYQKLEGLLDPEQKLGMASRSFYIWGPGRTLKLQCDTSAMISEDMFAEFVVPRLTDLCSFGDNVLYHLDGTDAVRHLDALLQIDSLSAIEWTPEAGKPSGASPDWYPMYRKILETGKSLQIVYLDPTEVPPLLDAIGTNGVYVMPNLNSMEEVESLLQETERYR